MFRTKPPKPKAVAAKAAEYREGCTCALCVAEASGNPEAVRAAWASMIARAQAGEAGVFVAFGGFGDDDDDDDEIVMGPGGDG